MCEPPLTPYSLYTLTLLLNTLVYHNNLHKTEVLTSHVSWLCQEEASLHMSENTGRTVDPMGVEPMPSFVPSVVDGGLKIDGNVGQSQMEATVTIARWLVRAWRLPKLPHLHRNAVIAKTCSGGASNESASRVTSRRDECVVVREFLFGTYLDRSHLGAKALRPTCNPTLQSHRSHTR